MAPTLLRRASGRLCDSTLGRQDGEKLHILPRLGGGVEPRRLITYVLAFNNDLDEVKEEKDEKDEVTNPCFEQHQTLEPD